MALKKNPGPVLNEASTGSLDNVPPPHRAKGRVSRTKQKNPTDVDLTTLTGDLVSSEISQTETDERLKINTSLVGTTDLLHYELTPQGQIVTETDVMAAGATVTESALVVAATVEDLGTPKKRKRVKVVSSVFPETLKRIERPTTIPTRFQLGGFLFSEVTASTDMSDPVLGDGELVRQKEKVHTQKVKTTVETLGGVNDDVLIDYKIDKDKELITVENSVSTDSTPPTVNEFTEIVEVNDLGNGLFERVIGTRPEVFGGEVYSARRDERLPARLMFGRPLLTASYIEAGLAAPPSLDDYSVEASETQLDKYTKRVMSSTRGGDYDDPVNGTLRTVHGRGLTLEEVTTTATVAEITLQTLEAETTPLGNGEVIHTRTTLEESTFPVRHGQEYDEQLGLVLPYTVQAKAMGDNIGDDLTIINPIDFVKADVKVIEVPTEALDAYQLPIHAYTNIRVPDVMSDIAIVFEYGLAEGEVTESGANTASGSSWSINLSLGNNANSSAAVIPDIQPLMKEYWTDKLPVVRWFFYLPNPVSLADILTRLATPSMCNDTVLAWPVFKPEPVYLTLRGERVAVSVIGRASSSQSYSPSSTTEGYTEGTGKSIDSAMVVKNVAIRPTLHPIIYVSYASGANEQEVDASATMEITGTSPTASGTSTATATATAHITPAMIPATDPPALPVDGLYLSDFTVENYKWGYSRVAAEVFDFAVLTP